eukprot:CFRG5825T1
MMTGQHMCAVVFGGPRKIEYRTDVPMPRIQEPTDAIIKVSHAGLCGSDLHPYSGREGGLEVGTIMGHEFVGVVHELGYAVDGLKLGDTVCSPFTTCCGECFYCINDLPSRCVKGQLFGWKNESDSSGLHGAQAEFIRVPLAKSTLMKLPEKLPAESALLVGDILSTGYFCASRADIPTSDAVVVVVGMGPVGMLALISAFEKGGLPGRVFAVDCVPKRLEKAKEIGAIPIDFTSEDPNRVLMHHVGRLADSVLECVGSGASLKSAFGLVRPGGTLSSVGVATDDTLPFSPADCYDSNITLRFGRCPARYFMPIVADWLQRDERVADVVASVVSHRLPLREATTAYEMFSKKSDLCTKVVFINGME